MFPPANNVLHSYMVMEATINVNIFMVPLSMAPNKKKDLCGYIQHMQSLVISFVVDSAFFRVKKQTMWVL